MRTPKNQALTGYIIWTDSVSPGRPRELKRAILRGESELAIDCDIAAPGEAPLVYTIVLKRVDDLAFAGEWSVVDGAERDSGQCSCRLYSNGPRFGLIGGWQEDGRSAKWFAELYPREEKA